MAGPPGSKGMMHRIFIGKGAAAGCPFHRMNNHIAEGAKAVLGMGRRLFRDRNPFLDRNSPDKNQLLSAEMRGMGESFQNTSAYTAFSRDLRGAVGDGQKDSQGCSWGRHGPFFDSMYMHSLVHEMKMKVSHRKGKDPERYFLSGTGVRRSYGPRPEIPEGSTIQPEALRIPATPMRQFRTASQLETFESPAPRLMQATEIRSYAPARIPAASIMDKKMDFKEKGCDPGPHPARDDTARAPGKGWKEGRVPAPVHMPGPTPLPIHPPMIRKTRRSAIRTAPIRKKVLIHARPELSSAAHRKQQVPPRLDIVSKLLKGKMIRGVLKKARAWMDTLVQRLKKAFRPNQAMSEKEARGVRRALKKARAWMDTLVQRLKKAFRPKKEISEKEEHEAGNARKKRGQQGYGIGAEDERPLERKKRIRDNIAEGLQKAGRWISNHWLVLLGRFRKKGKRKKKKVSRRS